MSSREPDRPERTLAPRPVPVRRVRKRDGRELEYDATRIADAVSRAQSAVSDDDPLFASEVADVVTLTLAVRHGRLEGWDGEGRPPEPSVPGIEEIQDLVEQALIEMGRARVAKAFILYRDRRARSREALSVHAGMPRADTEFKGPIVRDSSGASPWSRGRIVAALMEEADLAQNVAEDVAARVEHRVFDSGLRRLTTSLLRELVDNELFSMGLRHALLQQEPVSLPRHDLRRLFGPPARQVLDASIDYLPGSSGSVCGVGVQSVADVAGCVASEILSRYALEDVFDERVADMHRSGDLYFEDVTRPHLVLTRSVQADLLLRREVSAHSAFELFSELAPLVRETAFGLVLEDASRVLHPLSRGPRGSAHLADFLRALGALGRAAGRSIDLTDPGGRSPALLARVLVELAILCTEGAPAPRLFLAWQEVLPALDEDPAARDAAESLLRSGRLVPVWHSGDERWVAPGCRRRGREKVALACAGAVAVNLPRIARRAGPWREDLAYEALAAMVEASLDALERLEAFQREVRGAHGETLRERRVFALTPVGLCECLRILGDGELSPDLGARLLGLFSEAAGRFASERGLSVVLSPMFGARARARFAAIDAKQPRAFQARLFEGLPAPEDEREAVYTSGYLLPRSLGAPGEAEAKLLATLRSGALFPWSPRVKPVLSSAALDDAHPAIAAWERFAELRAPRQDAAPHPFSARPGSLFAGRS